MSSILDALKKSEAERQRGQPPTIGSSLPAFRREQSRRRFPVWILPVSAIVAAVAAWQFGLFGRPDDATVPATGAEVATADATQVTPSTTPSGNDTVSQAPPVANQNPAPAAPASAQPSAVTQDEPARRGFRPPGAPSSPSASTENAAQAQITPPDDGIPPATQTAATQPPATQQMPASSANGDATPIRGISPISASPDPLTPSERVADATAPKPTAPPDAADVDKPEARDDDVPTIHELSFTARKSLPEIAVTMHVYSQDPSRRFALVNGVRARDGESLEGGVEIVRILPHGVRLRVAGTEFVLPVSN